MAHAILNTPAGGLYAALPGALRAAGFATTAQPPASLLVNFVSCAEAAIAGATAFGDAVPGGDQALLVNILPRNSLADWPAYQNAALIWAFTRHAALAWAPRRIRVNAIAFGDVPYLHDQPVEDAGRAAGPGQSAPATPDDLAATVLAIWRFPSMTGQVIRLTA